MKRQRISQVSLAVYGLALLLSLFVPISPPGLLPLLGVATLAALACVFAGPKNYRVLGVLALAVVLSLCAFQLYQGKKLYDAREELKQRVEAELAAEKSGTNTTTTAP